MAKNYVLGIDIGGSLTKLGIVDETGGILARKVLHTQGEDPFEVFLDRVKEEVDRLSDCLEEGDEIIHAGIGAPNANPLTGKVENPPNLGWERVTPLASAFTKKLQVPVTIANDANAAALGEMRYGMARGMKNFIVLTLGTGLGSGIVVDGQLVLGQHGTAGELGHVTVVSGGRHCNCGRAGCLETYASVTGIRRTVFELLSVMNDESVLRSYSFEELNGENVSDAALEGDPIALQAFQVTADMLGSKMADAVAHLDPEAFILAGGLSKAGNILLDPLIKSMERSLFTPYKGKVKVLLSQAARSDALLGPAALAWGVCSHAKKSKGKTGK